MRSEFFPWYSHYAVGIEEMDREHQELVRLVGELHETRGAAAKRALFGSLSAAVEKHFATEERLMREHGYSGLELHLRAHDALVERLGTIKAPNQRVLGEIKDWLRDHLMTSDKPLAEFLKSRRA
jgi:hemerythrin